MRKQDSIAVANFIIERALNRKNPVTNLQLQKIMFLLQGYWLEKTGQELFREPIKHGRLQPLIFSVEKEFKCYASAPIENKACYFSCCENKIKEPTVDQKAAKKLKKITNKMLDYNRRNMICLFFENDESKLPTIIEDEYTKQTWTNFTDYRPDEIIQKYHDVTTRLKEGNEMATKLKEGNEMATKEKQKWVVLEKNRQPFYGEEMMFYKLQCPHCKCVIDVNANYNIDECTQCGTKLDKPDLKLDKSNM